MDNVELKRKLLNTTMLEEIAKDEILKKMNLIENYKLNTDIVNLKTNNDGTIEYDIVIHHKITPKNKVEDMLIEFDVIPNVK